MSSPWYVDTFGVSTYSEPSRKPLAKDIPLEPANYSLFEYTERSKCGSTAPPPPPLLRIPEMDERTPLLQFLQGPLRNQNLPREISSSGSYLSSPVSTDKNLSAMSKISSVASSQSESVDTLELLLDVLMNDSELAILYDDIPLFRYIDKKLEQNLGRLFREFGANLRREARDLEERSVARFVCMKAKEAARRACQAMDRLYENRFLEEDKDPLNLETGSFQSSERCFNSSDEDEEVSELDDHALHEKDTPILSQMKRFLEASWSLKFLRFKLRIFAWSGEYPRTRRERVEDLESAIIATSSRTDSYGKCLVKYEIIWEVPEYMKRYHSPGRTLGEVMTITGNVQDAIAIRCQDYVYTNWRRAGPVLLDLIERLLQTSVKGRTFFNDYSYKDVNSSISY